MSEGTSLNLGENTQAKTDFARLNWGERALVSPSPGYWFVKINTTNFDHSDAEVFHRPSYGGELQA